MGKRAAVTGTNSLLLVVIIIILVILYILFLPPAEREELLRGNKSVSETPSGGDEGSFLLRETPGTLQPEQQKTFEHKVDSVTVSTMEDDRALKSEQSVYVSASRNSEKTKKVVIVSENPKNVRNAKLSFNVASHKGRLVILLNDVEIFNGEVASYTDPVSLSSLKGDDIIELKASSPGWRFWETNFYELENVKVTATVKDTKNQESIERFYVSEEEGVQIESAKLVYYVTCNKVGSLAIYLNGNLVSSGLPDCSSGAKKVIDPQAVKTGANELRFYTEDGAFVLDNVMVVNELRQALNPTYYFDVNRTDYVDVQDGRKDVVLSMRFADNKRKVIDMVINGHKTQVDTESDFYSRTLTRSWVEKGANYIMLEPQTVVRISELKVALK